MVASLTTGSLERIVGGETIENPILQVLSSKKISAQGSSADRYRLLLSDGDISYSHAMLATQLNNLMESGEMDNLSIVQVDRYLCNTIQGDRRVMILLGVTVLHQGIQVGQRIGNPQQLKAPGQSAEQSHNSAQLPPEMPKQEGSGQSYMGVVSKQKSVPSSSVSPYSKAQSATNGGSKFSVKGGAGPGTPGTPGGSTKVHGIATLTPYQNRWRIRARITQKSGIRTWSNSRGEGKLFSVNLMDETGEIRATGFNEAVDRYYEMLEVNKVYYVTKGTLKTANKQYSNLPNDYEMTFNPDTQIEVCNDAADDLPTIKFDFKKLNELESIQPGQIVDVVGIVKEVGDVGTVVGKQSQKEITKREVQLVDQSGMVVRITLWGNDAQTFKGDNSPVMAIRGARLSDFGGRSLSVLGSSQMVINPDHQAAHLLRGWYDRDGHSMDFSSFKGEGGMGGGSGTNWKNFSQVKTDNIGGGEKPDYFTSKGTVIFLKKENSMYRACPTETCNKKLVDQGNGMYRCEKCSREFPNFKWRMILSANLADYSDNQWITCFQESAELLLGKSAQELGDMQEADEAGFEQVFQDAVFKSYTFKLRAKVETYNDESRLKTVCMNATPLDFKEHSRRLIDEINKMGI